MTDSSSITSCWLKSREAARGGPALPQSGRVKRGRFAARGVVANPRFSGDPPGSPRTLVSLRASEPRTDSLLPGWSPGRPARDRFGRCSWKPRAPTPAPGLLATCLRVKGQPDQIPRFRNVCAGYHTSCPTGGPQSVSPRRFLAVMAETSCSRLYLRRAGRMTTAPPFPTASVSRSPARSRALSAMPFGMRTARL